MSENHIPQTTPDPSTASVEAIATAIQSQRDYVDGKFETLTERLRGIDRATETLEETINRTPTKDVMNERFVALKESGLKQEETFSKQIEDKAKAIYDLTDTKFVTLKTVVEANAAQVALALDASEKAISKAETATDKRFEAVNGFRALFNDMATRREVETAINELKATQGEMSKQLSELRSRLDVGPAGLSTLQNQYAASQGVSRGADITMSKIYAAIGAVGAILGIIILLANGIFK